MGVDDRRKFFKLETENTILLYPHFHKVFASLAKQCKNMIAQTNGLKIKKSLTLTLRHSVHLFREVMKR